MKIGIDCGHTLSGVDYGASGIREESELTREIGLKVIDKLKQLGYEVIDCTCDSANSLGESLTYRVNTANNNEVDIFVCVHFNCFNTSAHGVEIFTYGGRQNDKVVRILNNLVSLGFTNRGIKDGSNLFVIRNTSMEGMLIECCFCDSQEDMNIYDSEKVANAIVLGLVGELPQVIQTPTEQPKTVYDTNRPAGNNIFPIGSHSYIEETDDGRTILHRDRANYITIGQGFIDAYWNDGKGNSGNKKISE